MLELLYAITPHKDTISDRNVGKTIQMPKHRKSEKKPIEQYEHKEASCANNPPVGLVTPETDRDAGKKTYAYDPHIDPPYGIKYGSNFQPFVNRRDVNKRQAPPKGVGIVTSTDTPPHPELRGSIR